MIFSSIFLQVLLCQVSLNAQDINSIVFGREQGLNCNYINDIARDHRGFFWIATNRGLIRFDGTNFLDIPDPKASTRNILRIRIFGNRIYLIYYDFNGIDTLNIPTMRYGRMMDGPLSDIIELDNSTQVAYRNTGELIRIHNGRIAHSQKTEVAFDGILKLWNGRLFLQATGKKMICADPVSLETYKEYVIPNAAFLRGGFEETADKLIVNMIGSVKYVDREFRMHDLEAIPQGEYGTCHSLAYPSDQYQYFIREDKELVVVKKGAVSGIVFPGRTIKELRTLFTVDSVNVLIGTNGSLIHYRNQPLPVSGFNGDDRLSEKSIRVRRNIIPVSRNLTILSGYPGILQWSPDGVEAVQFFRSAYFSDLSRQGDYFYGVNEGQEVNWWNRRTGDAGIYKAEISTGKDQLVTIAADPSSGDLLVAGRGGLFRFDPAIKKLVRVADSGNHLATRLVPSLTGGWWLCTEGGLLQYSRGFHRKRIIDSGSEGMRLTNEKVSAVLEVEPDKVWVGHERGAQLLDLSSSRVLDSLPATVFKDPRIADILKDTLGRIWFSTYNGILAYDGVSKSHLLLGENSNLINQEFNKRSAAILPDGRMMFGGIGGYDIIDPYAFSFLRTAKHGIVSAVSWYNEDGSVKKIELEPDPQQGLRFNIDEESIRIFISTSDLLAAASCKFQFKLNEGAWKDLEGKSHLDIYKLNPGNYTIEFRGIDRYGLMISFKPVLLFAEVAVYKSIYFIAVVLSALVISLVGIIFIIRYNQLNEKKLKESISMDLHDEVGTMLTRALMVSRQPVTNDGNSKLQDYLSDALFSLRTYIRTMNKKKVHAGEFSSDLQDFIQSTLLDSGIDYRFRSEIGSDPFIESSLCRDIKLIFFELNNNMIKHSRATVAAVVFRAEAGSCTLDFSDNGCLASLDDLRRSGYGLNNIEKRAARCGGTASWMLSPGGTGLRVVLHFIYQ